MARKKIVTLKDAPTAADAMMVEAAKTIDRLKQAMESAQADAVSARKFAKGMGPLIAAIMIQTTGGDSITLSADQVAAATKFSVSIDFANEDKTARVITLTESEPEALSAEQQLAAALAAAQA